MHTVGVKQDRIEEGKKLPVFDCSLSVEAYSPQNIAIIQISPSENKYHIFVKEQINISVIYFLPYILGRKLLQQNLNSRRLLFLYSCVLLVYINYSQYWSQTVFFVSHHDVFGHPHSTLPFCPTLHNRLPLPNQSPLCFHIFIFINNPVSFLGAAYRSTGTLPEENDFLLLTMSSLRVFAGLEHLVSFWWCGASHPGLCVGEAHTPYHRAISPAPV